jgi:hypothetical protein
MIRPLLLSVFVLFLLVSAPAIAVAVAWESYPPPLTLTERIAGSDTVVFAEFLSSVESTVKARRDGRYRILHLAKPTKAAEVGQIVVVARGGNRKAGEQAILAHHKAPSGDWWTASPSISRACFDYALAAPHPNEKDSERVAYFLRHLISSDSQISGDAFVELERVPFPTLAASAKLIPREFVAARLRDEATSASQVGLYGHLLGLAGNESDQRLLRGIIEQAPRGKDSFVPGFDGIAGGYLLLAGSEGLDWFEEFWVKDSRNPQTPFWHNYSAMLAVRFMWRNGEGRISRPRLRESMRLFLNSPEMADLAITALVRWEDWSVHDRLVEMLRNPEFDAPQTKRTIIRYMAYSMRVPPEVQAHDPQGFCRAERFIRELRDTKWVTRTGVVQGFGHTNIVKIYESRIDLEPRTDLESQEPLTPFRKLLRDFAAVFVLPKDPAADDTPADPPDDPKAADQQTLILKRLKDVDALVFKSKGIVVEVIANPDAELAFNAGAHPILSLCTNGRLCPHQTFTAGENHDFYAKTKKGKGAALTPKNFPAPDGVVWHLLLPVSDGWNAGTKPRFTLTMLQKHIDTINAEAGVTTLDVPIAADGSMPEAVLETLKSLGRESDKLRDGVYSY